jgi:hypothetical protein
MWEARTACISVAKLLGKQPLGRPRGWRITTDLRKMDFEDGSG